MSDIVLLFNRILQEKLQTGEIQVPLNEQISIPREAFQRLAEECRERFGAAWNKTYREMTFGEIYREMADYMKELMLIEENRMRLL